MSKAATVKVTNKFTGKTTAYEGINAFRKEAKAHYDRSVASLLDVSYAICAAPPPLSLKAASMNTAVVTTTMNTL